MEINKLSAALNWDSKFDANPWDLRYADIDLAMTCYPSDSVQIPVNFIQLEGNRGYSVGVEYSYDLFIAKNQQSRRGHADPFSRYYRMHEEDDDMEQMQREQEEEFQWEWDSFYEQFRNQDYHDSYYYQQQEHYQQQTQQQDDQTQQKQPNEQHKHQQQHENWQHQAKQQEQPDLTIPTEMPIFDAVADNISWMEWLVDILDMKYIQGILKFHVQKPFRSQQDQQQQQQQQQQQDQRQQHHYDQFSAFNTDTTTSDFFQNSFLAAVLKTVPQAILMNHLSMIFGNNKVCANIGFNTRTLGLSSKLMTRRKFFLKPFNRPLYISASVINPQSPNRIAGISAAVKSVSLQIRRCDGRNAIALTKRSYWTPFSKEARKRYLDRWKSHYEQEEVIKLPPPPIFYSALPPEMRFETFHSERQEEFKTSDISSVPYMLQTGVRYIDKLRNIIHQFSKILRYFIDIQIATAESTFKNFWPFKLMRYKSLVLSRFYEQLYLISMGPRSRSSIEYSWKKGKDYSFSHVYRLPFECNWGCDLFRVWLFLDLYAESCKGQWKQEHSATIAITLFDVYTLFTYTLSLHPYFKMIIDWFKRLKSYLFAK